MACNDQKYYSLKMCNWLLIIYIWSFGHHYFINEIKIQVSVLSDGIYTDYFRVQINLS